MRFTILIYVLVGVLAVSLARFDADCYTWFLLLEFFVGLTQIIGSIARYIVFFKNKSQNTKILFKYWSIVAIYFVLALLASSYYEAHRTDPIFNSPVRYNIMILFIAWPIAFWYLFNISFLKTRKHGNN
jgi:hypothetical protein